MTDDVLTHTTTIGSNQHQTVTIDAPGIYEIELVGAGAEATIHGVFTTRHKQMADVTVIIYHQAPHTRSNTTLKGVARDASHIRFTGKIIVAPDCPDVNAFLTERILLLADTATAYALPELEILSDDVKCSHAASISHIPQDQLFYLMSRGVPHSTAEKLIVAGFLQS